jgi:purine-nucleoside phosphorylase
MVDLKSKISSSLAFLSPFYSETPGIAVVLGSGLGGVVSAFPKLQVIPTSEIPYYPRSSVPGHKGKWVFSRTDEMLCLFVQGRTHYYEGYPLSAITYPIHLLAGMGIKTLILTTASGGVNPEFKPGDLMIIKDHINFAFNNPLIGDGKNQLGPRFPDMSEPYDQELISLALKSGKLVNVDFRQGVFCWVSGPNYETASEVRMLKMLGVDAVSMSTVPEVIVAAQRHLRVLGISLITNPSTGLTDSILTHREVTERANLAVVQLELFLKTFVKLYNKSMGTHD